MEGPTANGAALEQHCAKTVSTVFIDLDDTLYSTPRVKEDMVRRIVAYLVNDLGLPDEGSKNLLWEYGAKYGTTLAGLVGEGLPVDIEKYYHDTHEEINLSDILEEDPQLRKILLKLNKPKYIFTNGSTNHARRVLKILGLSDLFLDIISYDTLQDLGKAKGHTDGSWVVCKPSPLAFELALEQAGASADSTLFLDDSVRNVVAAQKKGIDSILVGTSDVPEGVKVGIESIHLLPQIRPDLFVEE